MFWTARLFLQSHQHSGCTSLPRVVPQHLAAWGLGAECRDNQHQNKDQHSHAHSYINIRLTIRCQRLPTHLALRALHPSFAKRQGVLPGESSSASALARARKKSILDRLMFMVSWALACQRCHVERASKIVNVSGNICHSMGLLSPTRRGLSARNPCWRN